MNRGDCSHFITWIKLRLGTIHWLAQGHNAELENGKKDLKSRVSDFSSDFHLYLVMFKMGSESYFAGGEVAKEAQQFSFLRRILKLAE